MMKAKIAVPLLLLALAGFAACSKSGSDSVYPSISGLSVNDPAEFLAVGTVLTFQADVSKLATSDDTHPTFGISWQYDGGIKDTTTLNTALENPPKIITVEETGTHTMTCYAFGIDSYYYSDSYNCVFEAVDPETVVAGLKGGETVTFGEQTYYTLTAGGKTWTGNNLYLPGKGHSYRNSEVLDKGMGRLYSWEEAQTVCPAGWHLPTEAEFNASFASASGVIPSGDLMADATFQSKALWKFCPDVPITNTTGFNAIPAGYIDLSDLYATYSHYGEYAFFWTADQNNGQGTYLYIYQKYPEMRKASGDKNSLLLSVRCVKD